MPRTRPDKENSPPSSKRRRILRIAVVAVAAIAIYYVNIEVQTRLGRKAIAETGLQSLPLDEALRVASASDKTVLVNVSAVWCPSCRALDREVFSDARVAEAIRTSLVYSRLEYESAEATAFLRERDTRGFPNLWLLDAAGRPLRRLEYTLDATVFLQSLLQGES
jgi:thiol:disulfide interchange protein